jgi:hypothetical protein
MYIMQEQNIIIKSNSWNYSDWVFYSLNINNDIFCSDCNWSYP